ncbi:hepatocyte growth factor receptor-like [Saccostrea echinata]|uniref:hepatocyte growth factor receptor-like n=1 Tax=Saccostrea echinata TaxID=191078 RepID=UPI002A7FE80A|nr:hepatocyte growth factor receptor-like [Saccostrea echinata]
MLEFNHPNVMTLIGICLSLDEMPLVVLPYMKHGDLLCYIRNDKNMLTLRNLIEFATDISRGMEYLSIQKVVHRDLAARNCMLSECYRAVVADFGLSRDIYEKDYYSSNNRKTRLPVKWMAPENLEKGIYSPKSDVWSFGVVMWELLTRGSKPYPEVDGWDMLKYLKDSRRLPKPAKCPELLYTKMINCWNLDPDQRPTFSDLAEQLSEIVSPTDDEFETHSDYQSLQNTYINTGIEGYLELEN